MSYAAFKMMHWPTGISHCIAAFLTHSTTEASSSTLPSTSADGDVLLAAPRPRAAAIPNLVVAAGNIVEVYAVRVEEAASAGGSGTMDGIAAARLELVCHYRLHGNVSSMATLSVVADTRSNQRDSIVLAFEDAKITVLEYDSSMHALHLSSMHCYEGPDWQHLKGGQESFAHGPIVKTDPLGRCCGVLIYRRQIAVLKAAQLGQTFVTDDELTGAASVTSVRVNSSYIINLKELEIYSVKDFAFLHGYIEPVLAILHEREPTWSGCLPWKHHTCVLSAFSISTTLKQHPMIWSAEKLPHDAYKLLPVLSPIGGVLVICTNSIHYHSQSMSCSIALNNFASYPDRSSDMPKLNFAVELDAAHATWLANDVALFSTKTGELLILTLVYDGRVVQRLDLMKSKASVLTSGIATLGCSFFFLSSRLGDSILVQYTCGATPPMLSFMNDEAKDIESDMPSAKRLRTALPDASHDATSVEELSLYGTFQKNSESTLKSFSFTVRDSLINVGPLKDFSYGLRVNADANSSGVVRLSKYELVCCSGHGKNGALSILQQSVRPELITEVELSELAGCKGIWTVYHKSSRAYSADTARAQIEDDEYHSYLIISLESRTMVLETADHLAEVTETVDYYVQGKTIAAGNLFGRRRVLQIFSKGARVLDGSYMTQELIFNSRPSELSSSEPAMVVSASFADPYVLMKMFDGTIQLLVGDPSTCNISISVPAPFSSLSQPISACTLYSDRGPEPWLRKTSTDAWLTSGISETIDANEGSYHDRGDIYCVICYESGNLEIFDVPNFNSLYLVENFVIGKNLLTDNNQVSPKMKLGNGGNVENASMSSKKEGVANVKVVELALHRWPGRHSRPFLFGLLDDGSLFCYHGFLYEGQDFISEGDSTHTSTDGSRANLSRLRNLRFSRISFDSSSRDENSNLVDLTQITTFNNIGGYQGLFLGGSRPTWFMVCRERLRAHPQICDGPIVAFAVLHNAKCNHGLIYVTSLGVLKICQIPSTFNYDNYWPVQKIPLQASPHAVSYYAEKNLYALVVSTPVLRPSDQVLSSITDQDMGHRVDIENSDDLQKNYKLEEFEVRILEAKPGGRWDTRTSIPMQTFENVLTLRTVTLHNKTTKENDTLLAIGTGYAQGEDISARGRILLYAFTQNTENPQNLVTEVYSMEVKGAVSALASLQGLLLIASGTKITLNEWIGNDLNGVAFYDTPLHVVSLNIVKNFILSCDIHKSIYFLNWKEQGRQLIPLSKDFGSLDSLATEFLIDGSTLSLVVSDVQKNIQMFYYAPKMLESWKGQKLLTRAEFHAGAHISKFLRLQMLSADRVNVGSGSEKTNRFALLFCTLDGGIGCLSPLDELTFRRLQALQKRLVNAVPHACGLNPRSFRQFRANGKAHRPGPDNIVDIELLSHYENLTLEEQLDVAHQIGTTRSQILANLTDLSIGTSFL